MKPTEQYTDLQVVDRIRNGEPALFEILIRRYNPFLYKIGRSYNYSHDDTQDLMQETFIDSYTHLSDFENRSAFKTWIIKIMLNNCFRKQQKWAFKNVLAADIVDKSTPLFSSHKNSDTNSLVMNRELSLVIENALRQVPLDYRMVFVLREVNGMNVAETANVLDISETNVKVRLNRAKNMLRREVEKSYSREDIFEFNLTYCNAIVEHVMHEILDVHK